jgi:flagellar basal body-associated protein FliL
MSDETTHKIMNVIVIVCLSLLIIAIMILIYYFAVQTLGVCK